MLARWAWWDIPRAVIAGLLVDCVRFSRVLSMPCWVGFLHGNSFPRQSPSEAGLGVPFREYRERSLASLDRPDDAQNDGPRTSAGAPKSGPFGAIYPP